MGEIADALRRSRAGGLRDRDPGPARPAFSAQPVPCREPRIEEREARPFSPRDPAILTEGRPEAEACRQLALQLRSELQRHGARSVAIVSALRDEGKTTTSCNLALSLASLDTNSEIAVVDLDLRRPSLARVLGLDATVGVEEVLAGRASLEDARIPIGQHAVDVFPAKVPQRNAHEILTTRHLSEFITALERRYEVVIVDTPPVLLVPDTRLILERVPLCVPVARAGRTRVRSFREMIEALPQRQVLSTLLNGARRSSHYYASYDYASEPDPGEVTEHEASRQRGRSGRSR